MGRDGFGPPALCVHDCRPSLVLKILDSLFGMPILMMSVHATEGERVSGCLDVLLKLSCFKYAVVCMEVLAGYAVLGCEDEEGFPCGDEILCCLADQQVRVAELAEHVHEDCCPRVSPLGEVPAYLADNAGNGRVEYVHGDDVAWCFCFQGTLLVLGHLLLPLSPRLLAVCACRAERQGTGLE